MKKFLVFLVIIVFGIAAVVQFTGSVHQNADGLTLAEAAFSVRGENTTDATTFLVGKFSCEDGSKIVFDGRGGLRQISMNFEETEGSYTLTEAPDGAAVVRMDLGSGPALYSFRLTSPEGEFTLTDAANIAHVFTPVE